MQKLPPEEFYPNLPKKITGSAALFFNKEGELLIVKPNYKDTWLVPGGYNEANESPAQNCAREVKEELGLDKEFKKLLCVDYVGNKSIKGERVQFIFYGGVLSEEEIKSIKLQEEELDEFVFTHPKKALHLMSKILKYRIGYALLALKEDETLYIENKFYETRS